MDGFKECYHYDVSFQEQNLSTTVTCLSLIKQFLFAGEGTTALAFNLESGRKFPPLKIFKLAAIHGFTSWFDELQHSGLNVLVWGQKSMAILSLPNFKSCYSAEWKISIQEKEFSDWIIEAKCCNDSLTAMAVTAHNVFFYVDLKSLTVISEIKCSENSLLYCGALWGNSLETCLVFGGTVFGQILVWIPSSKHGQNNSTTTEPIHRLTGIKGALFSIHVDMENNLISTTSDDRSVRLWKIEVNENCLNDSNYWKDAKISQIFCSYGHVARVWKSVILKDKHLLTCGEDSTVCYWSSSGVLRYSWEAHDSASIRSIAANKTMIFTGGSDGAIKMWRLNASQGPTTSLIPQELTLKTLTSPMNLRNDSRATSTAEQSRSNFPRTVNLIDPSCLAVVCNDGCIYKRSFAENKFLFADDCLKGYAVTALNSHFLILGTLSGSVLFVDINTGKLKSKLAVSDSKIDSLLFVNDRTLVTCSGLGNIKMWSIVPESINNPFCVSLEREYKLPKCKQRWITAACVSVPDDADQEMNTLIVGDPCGNINLFSKNEESVHTLDCLHGKRGVSSVNSDLYENSIITAGRDGYIRRLKVKNDTITVLHEMKVPMGSWIGGIIQWNNRGFVLIFSGPKLQLWDFSEKLKMCEFNCGGGHRSWDMMFAGQRLNTSGDLLDTGTNGDAVSIAYSFLKDGCPYLVETSWSNQLIATIKPSVSTRIIRGAHYLWSKKECSLIASGGEDTLLHLHLISRNRIYKLESIKSHLSSIKSITIIQNWDILNSPECNSKLETVHMVTYGGRAQFKVWEMSLTSSGIELMNGDCSDLNDETECSSIYEKDSLSNPLKPIVSHKEMTSFMLKDNIRKNWKSFELNYDPETRFMDTLAFWISQHLMLLIIASSDGFLRIFKYSSKGNGTELLYEEDCEFCLLKLCCLKLKDFYVAASDTRGRLLLWNLQNLVRSILINEPQESIGYTCYQIESSGLNSLDVTSCVRKNNSSQCIHVVAGGDSGTLSIIEVLTDDLNSINSLKVACSSSLHAAQVSGVSWLAGNLLISAAIDQRLILWKFEVNQECCLVPLKCCFTSIPDVQGIRIRSVTSVNEVNYLDYSILVYGCGVHIFALRILKSLCYNGFYLHFYLFSYI